MHTEKEKTKQRTCRFRKSEKKNPRYFSNALPFQSCSLIGWMKTSGCFCADSLLQLQSLYSRTDGTARVRFYSMQGR